MVVVIDQQIRLRMAGGGPSEAVYYGGPQGGPYRALWPVNGCHAPLAGLPALGARISLT